jgi:tight adherence protein C
MSSLYLPLALVATFGAVTLGVLGVQASLAYRRRALEFLRSQIKEVDLRDKELTEPFLDRVVLPLIGSLGQAAKQFTPVGFRERIARKLVLAGNPAGMDAEKVAALKVFGALGGAAAALGLAALGGAPKVILIGGSVFGGLFCYLIPGAGLGQKAIHRQEEIRRALPDTIDLLTVSVEAGLGFDAALAHVRKNVPGPLSDEIGRMQQEVQLGVNRSDALRGLAQRSNVEELKAFVLSVVQADIFGISIAKILRSQARELRIKRRQRAEEQAIKVPVKLLFPLIFCILPSMFIVLVGPGVIRIMQTFLGNTL